MMKSLACLPASCVLMAAGMAHADFDDGECASIRDVRVPYEIALEHGIHFEHGGDQQLSITPTGKLLNARSESLNIGAELERRMVEAVRDFVDIGTRFASHFGPEYKSIEPPSGAMDEPDETTPGLFSDSCRNLYELKHVQARISEQDATFSPVIIVHGF